MKNPIRQELYQKRVAKLKDMQMKSQGRKMVSRKSIHTKEVRVAPQLPIRIMPPRDHITLDVVQGLGDIFWVYQKVAPFYNKINLNICVVSMDNVQNRSIPWMKLFPKIQDVKLRIVKGSVYDEMASTKYDLEDAFRLWNTGLDSVPYAVNKWLETGVRIDAIDNKIIETSVELKTEDISLPFKDYITLYVSGSAKNRNLPCWSVDQWMEYVELIYGQYKCKLPVVVIGAKFDKEAIQEVENCLKNIKIDNISFTNEAPEKVCTIVKNSKLFIGYQSGLNIIADNFDTPQVMLYYEYLKKMLYTWCKKDNQEVKFFADLFSNKPEVVAQKFDLSKFLL